MVEFLDAYDIQKLTQDKIKNINILITTNEIEAIILISTRKNQSYVNSTISSKKN